MILQCVPVHTHAIVLSPAARHGRKPAMSLSATEYRNSFSPGDSDVISQFDLLGSGEELMTEPSEHEQVPRRQRQNESVRADIVKAAIERFLRTGFDETTLDEIAEDAAVSRGTVVHHFPAKEDIVLSWSRASADRLRAAVAAYPIDGKPPLRCLQSVMLEHLEAVTKRSASPFMLTRLIERSRQLRAGALEITAHWEKAVTQGLIARSPAQAETAEIVAAGTIAAVRIGTRRWLAADGGMSLPACIERAFDELALIGL